jgi:hypothetical protein
VAKLNCTTLQAVSAASLAREQGEGGRAVSLWSGVQVLVGATKSRLGNGATRCHTESDLYAAWDADRMSLCSRLP